MFRISRSENGQRINPVARYNRVSVGVLNLIGERIYILMMMRKGGFFQFHSIHSTEQQATAWKECKEHDGEDCEILYVGSVDSAIVSDFVDSVNMIFERKK